MNSRTPVSLFIFFCLSFPAAVSVSAQQPSMPDHPVLQDGFLAWDRGEYPAALRAYLSVLDAPGGEEHVREIALLTGELYQVTEVAGDGGGVRIARDGSSGTFEASRQGRDMVHVVELGSGRIDASFEGVGAVPGSGGTVGFFSVEETPGLQAAERRVADARARRDFPARNQARLEVAWETAKARSVHVWANGRSRSLDVEGRAVLSLHAAPTAGLFFAVLADTHDPASAEIYALSEGQVTALSTVSGAKQIVGVTNEHVVFSTANGVHAVARSDGSLLSFEGGRSASVAADGSLVAFLTDIDGAQTRLSTASLVSGGTSGRQAGSARVLLETDRSVDNPAVSPDGRWVAYQKFAVDDWELFVASTDGNGERQLSLEIQHDRYPLWLDSSRVLAAKGEGRHMRSFVYDVEGGAPTKLFHNNTVRTIVPEYEWAAAPEFTRVMIVSERDGDTVSPERGVYLVDLTTEVSVPMVRARLRQNLEDEEDLRARGEAAFAPIADEVRAVTAAVSVGRIFESARDVYGFGSKHVSQPGNALAIEYYRQALEGFGYEPELQWFEARGGFRTANVIVRISGTVDPELVYVASSHFDSAERSPGADDDSSGATALLDVARVLKNHPMPATVELAFFTGEEAGLLGSREYVRRAVEEGKQIVGALNNDMIGWANNHRLDNTIRYSNPGIRDIQHAAAIQFSDLITYEALYYKSTDAAAYYEAYGDIVGGIGSYPVLGNPHYHQSTDRLETINQTLVAEVARTTAATLMLLASSPARLTGLRVDGPRAEWSASLESGVRAYEVRWQTADGWSSVETQRPTVSLPGVVPGGEVRVRALHERGTVGWDWAVAPR